MLVCFRSCQGAALKGSLPKGSAPWVPCMGLQIQAPTLTESDICRLARAGCVSHSSDIFVRARGQSLPISTFMWSRLAASQRLRWPSCTQAQNALNKHSGSCSHSYACEAGHHAQIRKPVAPSLPGQLRPAPSAILAQVTPCTQALAGFRSGSEGAGSAGPAGQSQHIPRATPDRNICTYPTPTTSAHTHKRITLLHYHYQFC